MKVKSYNNNNDNNNNIDDLTSSNDIIDTKVLVIGGGIVGLTSALLLQQQNIECILVEKHPSTCIHPRARGFNSRTMEIWHLLGLDESIKEAGLPIAASKGIYSGRDLLQVMGSHTLKLRTFGFGMALVALFYILYRLIPGIWFSVIMSVIAYLVVNFSKKTINYLKYSSPFTFTRCTQDLAEPVLLNAFKQRKQQQQYQEYFNTQCISLEQDENEVIAILESREVDSITFKSIVKRWKCRCKYVLACDGANSFVRRTLDIPMEGKGRLSQQLNIYFKCNMGELVKGREFSMVLVENEKLRGLFASVNNDDRWVLHLSMADGETIDDYPNERCREAVKDAIGMKNNLSLYQIEILGALPWWSTVEVAAVYRRNRIILAGDAAHIYPPWGGFGGNSGIADAHNIVWKLSAVLRGEADQSLLDTYQAERRPVAEIHGSVAGSLNDDRGLIKNSVFSLPTMVFKVVPYMVVGYGYRSDSITSEGGEDAYVNEYTKQLIGQPGTRLPHHYVKKIKKSTSQDDIDDDDIKDEDDTDNDDNEVKDGDIISTLDLIDYKKSLLIIVGKSRWEVAARELIKDHHNNNNSSFELPLDIMVSGVNFDDYSIDWKNYFGISTSGAILVRPDGFVAWRSNDDTEASKQNLSTPFYKLYCMK